MTINPRSVTDAERPWIENWSPAAHRLLFRAVRDLRSARVAREMCSYLGLRNIGEDPGVSQAPKAEYRKLLAELADRGITPPPTARSRVSVAPGPYHGLDVGTGEPAEATATERPSSAPAARRRRRTESGVAQLGATAAVGAAGLAVTGHPALAAVVYITYTAGADDSAAAPSGGEVAGIHTLRAAPADDMPTYYTPVAA